MTILNKEENLKQAILLAAYGAGGVQGTHTLQLFEEMVRSSFPAASVRWAFTSPRMLNRLVEAGKKADSIKKALCRLGFEKYSRVTVQSLHMIPGQEYEAFLDEIHEASTCGAPAQISVGAPLLHTQEDIDLAAQAMLECLPAERADNEAVIWVGHGSKHEGGDAYMRLTAAVQKLDPNIFVGTLAGRDGGASSLLPVLLERRLQKAWLMPLLSVIGKHASDDIAGDEPDSFRGVLESGGLACCSVLRGAIMYRPFAAIWMRHLADATLASHGQVK